MEQINFCWQDWLFVLKADDQAVSKNLLLIQKFSQRIFANSTPLIQNSLHPRRSDYPTNICYHVDCLLDNSMIGDVRNYRNKIPQFQD